MSHDESGNEDVPTLENYSKIIGCYEDQVILATGYV